MKKLLTILGLISSSILFFDCSMNLDSMIDNYNSHYEIADKDTDSYEGPFPGDEDFDETSMLESEYFVYEDGTIILAGPENSYSYSWVVVDTEDTERTPIDVVTNSGSSLSSRIFSAYIPNSGLQAGKTYKITLTVTDSGGKKYKDNCGLIIYRHYNY